MPRYGTLRYPSATLERAVARIRAVAESPEMAAIQRALPISFVGLIAALGGFMFSAPGTLSQRFSASFVAAFGVMSAMLVVVLAIDLARRRHVSPWLATVVSCGAFALSLPYRGHGSVLLLAKAVGSSGLFLSIGIALATVAAIRIGSERLGERIGAVAGAALILAVAGALFAIGFSLAAALQVAIAPLADLGDSLTALVLIVLIETLLWTVGIHGPALLGAVILPVYANLQLQNTDALGRGDPLPHIVTVSMFLFVFPGGAGATLPLVLLLLRSKVRRVRNIAFATLLPSLANTNEPLMFGLPVVLNPTLAIPFVLAPVVLAIVSWEAMHAGIVDKPAYYIFYWVPMPFGAFLATKDWRAIVLSLLNFAISLAIWWPFTRIYERQQLALETSDEAA